MGYATFGIKSLELKNASFYLYIKLLKKVRKRVKINEQNKIKKVFEKFLFFSNEINFSCVYISVREMRTAIHSQKKQKPTGKIWRTI